MAYEPKNGQITIWKNEKYVKGGNLPYAKGKGLDLNGQEFEYTLWIPKSEKIKGFNMTISEPYVKPKNDSPKQSIEQAQTNKPLADDNLPF